jgi:transcriptional regulator with XRE-family HTH domain
VQRRGPTSGLSVDPARVREARLDAGLSLAQVAGNDVSRTLIHLIEHGRSRPSERVLRLIARRTGKPLSYFEARTASDHGAQANSLALELAAVADHVRRFLRAGPLTPTEIQAITLVEVNLHQAAALVRSLEQARATRSRNASNQRAKKTN